MSSENYPALKLDLVPSRIVLVSLVACHLLALIAIVLLVLPPVYKFGLGGLIVISLIHTYERATGIHKRSFIREIYWGDDGWLLRTAAGESRPAQLSAAYVYTWLVILRFNSDTVVIAPDSSDVAQVRRLRMRLLVAQEEDTGAEPLSGFWQADKR